MTVVSSQEIGFTNAVVGESIFAFDYPAAQRYSGRDLIYCAGTSSAGVQAGTAGLDCDMTGGSSGGPWYASFDTTSEGGTAVSVNSHIYRFFKDVMFGPVFDLPESDGAHETGEREPSARVHRPVGPKGFAGLGPRGSRQRPL